jgi:SAM-dependent methyltransferase
MLRLDAVQLVERDRWILDKVRGKRVLHAGATDSPLTAARAADGRLLHQKLNASAAASVVGVDLDGEAIRMLRERHGIDNIVEGDLEQLESLLPDHRFDVVLAADVLEHLSNPGRFLEAARRVLAGDGELIVSVPNAFSFKKFVGVAFFFQERNHPDHVCYYSPMNLGQLLGRYGFAVGEMHAFLTVDHPPRRVNRFANGVARGVMTLLRNANIADEWCLCARPALDVVPLFAATDAAGREVARAILPA